MTYIPLSQSIDNQKSPRTDDHTLNSCPLRTPSPNEEISKMQTQISEGPFDLDDECLAVARFDDKGFDDKGCLIDLRKPCIMRSSAETIRENAEKNTLPIIQEAPLPSTPFIATTTVTGLTPGFLLPMSSPVPSPILPPAQFTRAFVNGMSPEMVLWAASHYFPNTLAKMPPFRNESRETWRSVIIDNVPLQATQADVLRFLKPIGIECIKKLTNHGPQLYTKSHPKQFMQPRFELRFLDFHLALCFYASAALRPFSFDGKILEVSWAPSPSIRQDLYEHVRQQGASRSLHVTKCIGHKQLDVEADRSDLWDRLHRFGGIESIDFRLFEPNDHSHIQADKGLPHVTWMINFTSVEAALHASEEITKLPIWSDHIKNESVNFGSDRDCVLSTLEKQAALLYLGESPYNWQFLNHYSTEKLRKALAYQTFASALVSSLEVDTANIGNRCISLTRLPASTTLQDICNTVRGGMLESVKLVSEHNAGFVTFLEPTSAAQFWATYQMRRLTINSEHVKVGWGRHSGILPSEIATVVSEGITRNLCIKFGKAETVGSDNLATDGSVLTKVFKAFGTIEQVRVARDIGCSFVSFADISSAVQAANWTRETKQFPGCEVNYGKDRCAAISRSSSYHESKRRKGVHYARDNCHDFVDAQAVLGSQSALVDFLRMKLVQISANRGHLSPIPFPILPIHLPNVPFQASQISSFTPMLPTPAIFDETLHNFEQLQDKDFGGPLIPKKNLS